MKRFRSNKLALILIALVITGCIHRQGSNQPITPYENVMVWNDALAQTNNGIAKGLISISSTVPPLIQPEKTALILHQQRNIATADKALTAILKQGASVATANAAQIQTLTTQIRDALTAMVSTGTIGVKNPKSQQSFDADIQAISNLVAQITNGLKQAGVLQ